MNGGMEIMGVIALFNIILVIALLVCSVYGFILFVKLANRGIKALDIYIKNNKGSDLQ